MFVMIQIGSNFAKKTEKRTMAVHQERATATSGFQDLITFDV